MSSDETTIGPAPVDDGWEPEPARIPLTERIGGGPVEYFKAVPARFFAWLGAVVLLGGWATAVYIAWFADRGPGQGLDIESYKLQSFLLEGMYTTIAAGILWGVAAFLWVKVLPSAPDDATNTA